MTAYRPQVGDRVRRSEWDHHVYVDVTAVGGSRFLAIAPSGFEHAYDIERMDWVKVAARPELPDLPERWVVIHDGREWWHASLPYYDSPEHARERQDGIRATTIHPPDLAYVKYVPVPDSVVWADELEEK